MNATDLQSELERLHASSFGWALFCCGQRKEEAEDVLHTAYMKVLEGRAKFEGRSSFRTWFFGVIRHTASEQQRRRWLRETLLRRWFAAQPSLPSGDKTLRGASADSCALREALGPKKGRRYIPMSDRVLDILLLRCGERKEGWVFPSRQKGKHITGGLVTNNGSVREGRRDYPRTWCCTVPVTISAPTCCRRPATSRW
jgi:RNA polymerase sigma factor (sigma-70 family)